MRQSGLFATFLGDLSPAEANNPLEVVLQRQRRAVVSRLKDLNCRAAGRPGRAASAAAGVGGGGGSGAKSIRRAKAITELLAPLKTPLQLTIRCNAPPRETSGRRRRRCRCRRRQRLCLAAAHSLPQAQKSLCLCKRRGNFNCTMHHYPKETNITASQGAAAVVAPQRATILFFNGRYLAARRPPSYLP